MSASRVGTRSQGAGFKARELDQRTWPDLERTLEKHDGVWNGCWCVAFHLARGEKPQEYGGRRAMKEKLVRESRTHAALVFDGPDVVGWCQYGPPTELPARLSAYGRLELDLPDWRITCFFVDKDRRGEGIAKAALRGALGSIADKGGGTVDAYPTDNSREKPTSSSFLWSGTITMFKAAGFRKIGSTGKSKVVMRKDVRKR